MSYSRTFKKGKNKMRLSKKYLLNDDDIVAPIDVPSFECMPIGDQLMVAIDIDFISSYINKEHQVIYFERNVSNEN